MFSVCFSQSYTDTVRKMCDPIPLCDDGFMGVWIGWVISVVLILNIQTYKMLPGCN